MRRNKRYRDYKYNNTSNQETYLKKECYRLIDRIVATGEIKRQDLFAALAIRLHIPVGSCYINKFDKTMLEKAIKELKYML